MPAAQATSQGITLKGSVALVTEYFEYSINNILYQREIYPPEDFQKKSQYGLSLFITRNEALSDYINNVLVQMKAWLEAGSVQKLVLVIMSKETGETLERWVFSLEPSDEGEKVEKDKKTIHSEIAAIQRQITASTSFLPLNEDQKVFDLLVYTDEDTETPVKWETSDAKEIPDADMVQLRSFDTTKHKVGTSVAYKVQDY